MEIASAPIIVLGVYLLIETYKLVFVRGNNSFASNLIPCIAVLLGMVFSMVAFYLAPEFMPTDNLLMAIIIGIISGLSATGLNQIYKQFTKIE